MKTTNPDGPITDRDHPDYDPDLDPDNFIPCEICGASIYVSKFICDEKTNWGIVENNY